MFDSTDELLKQILVGEDSTLELKELKFSETRVVSPNKDSIATEIAAMANTIGGVLVLGVDDKSREIVGIPREKLEAAETWIRTICSDAVIPPLYCPIRKIIVPSADGTSVILRIDIPKSLFVHKSPLGYYVRIGSSKREMTPDMLARLFQQRSQARMVFFDEQPVPGTDGYTLDKAYWAKFKPQYNQDDDRDFLFKLKLLTADSEGKDAATVAGILMATENPQHYLSNAKIQAVAYRGKNRDSSYQIDARDIVGPLDVQISEACRFVASNMKVEAYKSPARIERPQYSLRAVFEAIVNAVAHRDYSIQQSCIRLHMFSDRLELFSPGAIPNTMTVESMALRQFSRNELLSSLLARCPLPSGVESGERTFIMDRRGEGVPIMMRETEDLSGKSLSIKDIDGQEVCVVLPAAFDEIE